MHLQKSFNELGQALWKFASWDSKHLRTSLLRTWRRGQMNAVRVQEHAHTSDPSLPPSCSRNGGQRELMLQAVSLETINLSPPPSPEHSAFWCEPARSCGFTSKRPSVQRGSLGCCLQWGRESYWFSHLFRVEEQSWSLCGFTFWTVTSLQRCSSRGKRPTFSKPLMDGNP